MGVKYRFGIVKFHSSNLKPKQFDFLDTGIKSILPMKILGAKYWKAPCSLSRLYNYNCTKTS